MIVFIRGNGIAGAPSNKGTNLFLNKQKTAYNTELSDCSSEVYSTDKVRMRLTRS